MKKNAFLFLVFPAIALISGYLLLQPKVNAKSEEPETVEFFDLKRYTGTWYEIARSPNLQKECGGNTTETYLPKQNGDLTVISKCQVSNGKMQIIRGEARVADTETNAKLKVRFAPVFLSFLPMVWSDNWIIDLDEDYQYAVIGDSTREGLRILSRLPRLDDETYRKIAKTVEDKGYDSTTLIKTPQNLQRN